MKKTPSLEAPFYRFKREFPIPELVTFPLLLYPKVALVADRTGGVPVPMKALILS
jgi:hypothetical protein